MPPAARLTDMHTCPMVTGVVPHVGGPILPPCEPTVLIGMLPAARVGDMAMCVGPPDTIAKGSPTVLIGKKMAARMGDLTAHGGVIVMGLPTVMIGDAGSGGGGGGAGAGAAAAGGASGAGAGAAGAAAAGAGAGRKKPSSIIYEGTPAEQQQLRDMVEKIRNSGPKGKAFIESLENSPNPTRLFIGTSATKKDGTVIPLSSTGGGITLRPSESPSGNNEVHVDPGNLINYTATDGSTVQETPEGLLLHEMGHAKLLNDGDPAQTTGGPNAESNVRGATNDIRQELGMKPER